MLRLLLVILAGAGLAMEAGLLGPLGHQVGHLWAALSIFGVGATLLWLLSLFFPAAQEVPWRDIPRWQLSGGLLGPIYVVVLTVATPVLGVAMTMIGVLVGQIVKSFAIDSGGWFGMPKREINPYRLAGMALVVLALIFTWLGSH